MKNKKEFQVFIEKMLDQSQEAKDLRAIKYKKIGMLSPTSKAKYIIQQISPYLMTLVSNLEESTDESTDNQKTIKEIKSCFDKLLEVLKISDHQLAFKQEFEKFYSFEKNFDSLYEGLCSHSKDIFSFTEHMFSTIIEDVKNKSTIINLSSAQALAVSDETHEYISESKKSKIADDSTIENVILKALLASKKSIKMEIIGRVYSYVETGHAQADLLSLETHEISESAKELHKLILDYIDNPDEGNFDEKNETRREKLAEIFNKRINEINITIKLDRGEQSCFIKKSELNCERVAEAGSTDISMQYYGNPEKLLVLSCTSNEKLTFTDDGKNSFNPITHMRIISRYLKGKSLKEINKESFAFSKSIELDTKITECSFVNIAPSIIKNMDYSLIFKNEKKHITNNFETLIANFPLIRALFTYAQVNSNDDYSHHNNTLYFNKNLIVGKGSTDSEWYENLIASVNKQQENRKTGYFNEKIFSYINDMWVGILNAEVKENFVVCNPGKTVLGSTQFMIQEFPSFVNKFINEAIINNKDINYSPDYKNMVKSLSNIAKEMVDHPMYKGSQICSDPIEALEGKISKLDKLINSTAKSLFKIKK